MNTSYWALDSEPVTLLEPLPEGQLTVLERAEGRQALAKLAAPDISTLPPPLLWLARVKLAGTGTVWREEGGFVTEKERRTGGQMEWEGPQPALCEKVMHLMYSNGTPDWGAIWSPGYHTIPSYFSVETTFSCRNHNVNGSSSCQWYFLLISCRSGKLNI